jgi:hypothetical protein
VANETQETGVRLFILASAVSQEALPTVDIQKDPTCGDHLCFVVNVDQNQYTFDFEPNGNSWNLSDLQGWP